MMRRSRGLDDETQLRLLSGGLDDETQLRPR